MAESKPIDLQGMYLPLTAQVVSFTMKGAVDGKRITGKVEMLSQTHLAIRHLDGRVTILALDEIAVASIVPDSRHGKTATTTS